MKYLYKETGFRLKNHQYFNLVETGTTVQVKFCRQIQDCKFRLPYALCKAVTQDQTYLPPSPACGLLHLEYPSSEQSSPFILNAPSTLKTTRPFKAQASTGEGLSGKPWLWLQLRPEQLLRLWLRFLQKFRVLLSSSQGPFLFLYKCQ